MARYPCHPAGSSAYQGEMVGMDNRTLNQTRLKTLRKFFRNQGTTIGLILVVIILLIAAIGPWFTPYQPDVMSEDKLVSPNRDHIFGTDVFGRDIFTRVIYGTRYSLAIGLGGASLALIIGMTVGLIAGYFGNKVDRIIMVFSDIFQAMPVLLFAIMIMAILGRGMINVIIAIAVTFAPNALRLTRGQVFTVKKLEYVEAARALGLSRARIMFKHILPNVIAPIIVISSMTIGFAILIEASLSFIGLGSEIPQATLGNIVADGRTAITSAWWVTTLPGLVILLVVMGFNLLGDGLRDLVDYKSAD